MIAFPNSPLLRHSHREYGLEPCGFFFSSSHGCRSGGTAQETTGHDGATTPVRGAQDPSSGGAPAAETDREVRAGQRETFRSTTGTVGEGARSQQRRSAGGKRTRAPRTKAAAPQAPGSAD